MLRAMLFDLDGVLLDSLKHSQFTESVKELGWQLPPGAEEEIKSSKIFGKGGPELKEHFFPGKTEEEWLKLIRTWARLDVKNVPFFGGMHYLFRWLKNHQIITGIISQRGCQNIIDLLNRDELLQFIDKEFIQGYDSYKFTKADGEKVFGHLFSKLRERGINTRKKNAVVYVGDSLTDIRCAKERKGLRFIGIECGPLTRKDFINQGIPEEDILHMAYAIPDWVKRNQLV